MRYSLQHVGVLGMKWGKRRSLKEHFKDSVKQKYGFLSKKDNASSDHKTASGLKKKKLSEMSNDELKKLTARLSLEKQYKDLTKRGPFPGEKLANELVIGTTKQLATKYIANAIESGLPKLIEHLKNKG
jgi:hypothetical protein